MRPGDILREANRASFLQTSYASHSTCVSGILHGFEGLLAFFLMSSSGGGALLFAVAIEPLTALIPANPMITGLRYLANCMRN